MKDNTSVLEANLHYAMRMVQLGCATPVQAAQACGVPLDDLELRLTEPPALYAGAPLHTTRFDA